MALTTAEIPILKVEIDDDIANVNRPPSGQLGLNFTDTTGTAALLSVVGGSGETIEPEFMDPGIFQSEVDMDEFFALTASVQRAWNNLLVGRTDSGIPIKLAGVRTQLGLIWTVTDSPITRAALLALTDRSASRSEVLFGEGARVRHSDVAAARDLT